MSPGIDDILSLLERHAPLMMRVADGPEREPLRRIIGAFRPKIHPATVSKLRRLRGDGATIGDAARECRVSWRTAWKYSQ